MICDMNCVADALALSHCYNRIQVAGGIVVVVLTHNMRFYPYLMPGQRILLKPLVDGWIIDIVRGQGAHRVRGHADYWSLARQQ